MKKFLSVLLTAVMCIAMLSGCGKNYDVENSTVFVLKNGKIVCTDVESFDTSVYSQEEFEAYVNTQIDSYNTENGDDSVKLKSVDVTDNIATLELEFADYTAFTGFTGVTLFVGSVAEALAAGYSFDGSFVSVDGDTFTDCDSSTLISATDSKVVIIDSAYNVNVYGSISYLSTENMSLVDENTVSFALGNVLTGMDQDTETEEAASEVTEAVEAVEDTESEAVEEGGSVDDDDWVIGTEAEEEIPEFVFDDDDSEADVTVSIGYAYIFFK